MDKYFNKLLRKKKKMISEFILRLYFNTQYFIIFNSLSINKSAQEVIQNSVLRSYEYLTTQTLKFAFMN